MAFPHVVSRTQWLEAGKLLLAQEKEQTRSQDALNAQRRRLPMVQVEKEYVFGGPRGAVTLAGMFGSCRQLIVHHIMFGPDWDEPCPSCRNFMDELSAGLIAHLHDRDTAFALVSRAPRAKIEAYQASRGGTVELAATWYSSYRGRGTTTGRNRGCLLARQRPRCRGLAASCVTGRLSSTRIRQGGAMKGTGHASGPFGR